MYQFIKPKFRFGLFLNKPSNSFELEAGSFLTCFADSYEIKEDGSIIFYQTAKTNEDKKFKIPVLAYPNSKWSSCILLDDENEYPVFQGELSPPIEITEQNPEEEVFENSYSYKTDSIAQDFSASEKKQNNSDDLLGELDSMLENEDTKYLIPTGNPQELKKIKTEWLEKKIKNYVKTNDQFILEEFLIYISKTPENKHFQATDLDVIWVASNLLLDKMVLARKFSDAVTQKTLSLILPDIMRRQWDGNLSPIIETLQDREETKNVNAIDLAVWMEVSKFNS